MTVHLGLSSSKFQALLHWVSILAVPQNHLGTLKAVPLTYPPHLRILSSVCDGIWASVFFKGSRRFTIRVECLLYARQLFKWETKTGERNDLAQGHTVGQGSHGAFVKISERQPPPQKNLTKISICCRKEPSLHFVLAQAASGRGMSRQASM